MVLFFLLVHVAGVGLLLGLSAGWGLAARTRWLAFARARRERELREREQRGREQEQDQVGALRRGQVGRDGQLPASGRSRGEEQGSSKGAPREGLLSSPPCPGSDVDSVALPSVALVLPARGRGEHLLANWRSQVLTEYPGPVQCFIVVGSQADPAYQAATEFRDSLKQLAPQSQQSQAQQSQQSQRSQAEVHVLVAGRARTCSQKIHNQLAGMTAVPAHTDFVLFLDDDVQLAPGTLGAFVREMQQRPDAFLVTGYPLDVPSPSSLSSFAAAAFHLPLSIVFSSGGRTAFVWGGCMFFRARDLKGDAHGVVSALKNGCYSDDMTVQALAAANHRVVLCPGYALFLQRLTSRMSLGEAWGYLRRQVFTCTTYSSLPNLLLNQAVMWLHCALSFTLVVATARTASVLTALLLWGRSHRLTQADVLVSWVFLACQVLCSLVLRQAQRNGLRLCAHASGMDLASPQFRALLGSTHTGKVWLGLLALNAMYPPCAVLVTWERHITWGGIRYERRKGRIVVCDE